jgi:hypothetical protein
MFPRHLLGLSLDTPPEADQLTTAFITPFNYFCYVKMPFGLKNTGLHTSGVCSSS